MSDHDSTQADSSIQTDPVQSLTQGAGLGRMAIKSLLPNLVIDLAVPIVIYVVLTSVGVPVIWSLAAGGVIPAVRVIVEMVRKRRLNGLALIVLIGFAVGLATSLITGDPRFAIAKEAVLTGAFGLILLGSLPWGRPLMFYVVRSALGGESSAWERLWSSSRVFPRGMAVTTAGLGVFLVIDSIMRFVVAYTLPVKTAGGVAQIVGYPLLVVFLILARIYGRRARRAFAEEQRAGDLR